MTDIADPSFDPKKAFKSFRRYLSHLYDISAPHELNKTGFRTCDVATWLVSRGEEATAQNDSKKLVVLWHSCKLIADEQPGVSISLFHRWRIE